MLMPPGWHSPHIKLSRIEETTETPKDETSRFLENGLILQVTAWDILVGFSFRVHFPASCKNSTLPNENILTTWDPMFDTLTKMGLENQLFV